MNSLITVSLFDENKLRAVMVDMRSLRTEIAVIRFNQRYDISGILTPGQKTKFNTKLIEKIQGETFS